MGRRFITARDVDDLLAAGGQELRLDPSDRLTDLARERAHDRGVAVVQATGTSQPPVSRPTSPAAPPPAQPPRDQPRPAASAATDTASDGPPRRQLRAAVRAGVVEEFGGAPEGLDAAIGRVFDRLGIKD
jgi:hypothetical protein